MGYDVAVRNARPRDSEGATDIGISDGRIETIGEDVGSADEEIDADGGLVASGFVDPHVHIDKAFLAGSVLSDESRTLDEAIRDDRERKREESVSAVKRRAKRAIEMHVRRGCTRLRTHVDIDPVGGLTALRGVLAAREACADIADVQIVAFPQEGIQSAPGTESLLREALTYEIDAIGGIPAIERTAEDRTEHVDICLSLAATNGIAVDMHVDETDDPTARSLEYLAARAVEEGLEGEVTAGHACALAAYDESHAIRVLDAVAEAELNVVTNPGTNLMLQGRNDQHPKRRGITRIDQLRERGVTVAVGQDNIRDAFYQFNRGDMLESAYLVAHAAHLQAPSERRAVWEMITENAAAVLDVESGLVPGAPATLNVFPSSIHTPTDALRERSPPAAVIHDGDVVAETTSETRLR